MKNLRISKVEKKKQIWCLLICLCVMMIFTSTANAATIKKVSVSKTKATVYVGKSVKLTASTSPSKISASSLKWKSSNTKIATVSKGVVKGKKKGVAKITVTAPNGKKAICTVTVKYIKSTSVKLNKTKLCLSKGQSYQLKATVSPTNASNKKVKWTSSNTSVATVTNGKVVAKKNGKATITCKTADGNIRKCTVEVGEKGVDYENDTKALMKAVAKMSTQATKEGTGGLASTADGATRRLIVKSKGSILSFSAYKPKEVIASGDKLYFVQFKSASDARKCYNSLKKSSKVKYVEYDNYFISDEAKSSSYNGKSWGVSKIGADIFADYVDEKTNSSIVVAVLDTGVAATHTFLKNRVLSNGYDLVQDDSNPYDDNGHGTHVSGTIVDCTNGVRVNILPIKVLDEMEEELSEALLLGYDML